MFLPNSRRSTKLLLMADEDRDGKIDLAELAQLFETVFEANLGPGDGDGESSGSTMKEPCSRHSSQWHVSTTTGSIGRIITTIASS